MFHAYLRLLADLALLMVLVLLPMLYVLFTDRFRRPISPDQFAALFALLAFAGILLFVPAITVLAVCGLLALGLARLASNATFSGVTYERSIEPSRLFPGDRATLKIRLNNRKLLPLSWVTIYDPLTHSALRTSEQSGEFLHFSGGIELHDNLGEALVTRTAVGSYQSLVRTYEVGALHRGAFALGPAELHSGDPFGIFRRSMEQCPRSEILVYPRLFTNNDVELPFRQIMGELVARRSLMEDPILLAGSREYVRGDPLNRMHWKATARTGDLQVRVADPSTTAQIVTVVNLNTFQQVWQGVDAERMEAAISVAASLSLWALQRGFAVGVRSNGMIAGGEHVESAPRLAPSASKRQEMEILEHLARLSFSGRISPETVLLDEARRLEAGSSIVFVTPIITRELVNVLTSRQLTGRVTVVYCGRFAAPIIRGLTVHLVTPPLERIRAVS